MKNWYHSVSDALEREALDRHLLLIHEARTFLVRALLPGAARILDLGGANAPLHKMGYSFPFDLMTIVDLPPSDRHEMYAQIQLVEQQTEGGRVEVLFADMTSLSMLETSSYDLVWSGQSIEHVPVDKAELMCRQIRRLLKPNGRFCLDTPNGAISSIHAATAGLKYVHPEHCYEANVMEMRTILENAGWHIDRSVGVRHMPQTVSTRRFHYSDFLLGAALTDEVAESYIQYHECRLAA